MSNLRAGSRGGLDFALAIFLLSIDLGKRIRANASLGYCSLSIQGTQNAERAHKRSSSVPSEAFMLDARTRSAHLVLQDLPPDPVPVSRAGTATREEVYARPAPFSSSNSATKEKRGNRDPSGPCAACGCLDCEACSPPSHRPGCAQAQGYGRPQLALQRRGWSRAAQQLMPRHLRSNSPPLRGEIPNARHKFGCDVPTFLLVDQAEIDIWLSRTHPPTRMFAHASRLEVVGE